MRVTREEFEMLIKAKLIKFDLEEKNFYILNKTKNKKRKKYEVVGSVAVKRFLGRNK